MRRCFATHTPRLLPATVAASALVDAQAQIQVQAEQSRVTSGARRLNCSQLLETTRKDVTQVEDKEVSLSGYIKSIRKQKKIAFAEINDGSSTESIQATFLRSRYAEDTLRPVTYPIQKKYHTSEFLRSLPHLRLRTPFNSLLSRFRSEALFAISCAFHERPDGTIFHQVHPPLITSGDCEGAGETFALTTRSELRSSKAESGAEQTEEPFFRSPRYLTVSSQLHLESFSAALGNVWTISPTFRAEKSDTPRHLSEFYMLEAEMQYLSGGLEELVDETEGIIKDITTQLAKTKAAKDILTARRSGESGQDEEVDDILQQRWNGILNPNKWPRVTYTDAIALLQGAIQRKKVQFVHPVTWGNALQFEHEKYLAEKLGGASASPVVITHYPRSCKPFYMLPSSLEEGYENSDRAT
ncbi:asparaginyl-tRNA synthetase, partial [Ascosphaera aggregata]